MPRPAAEGLRQARAPRRLQRKRLPGLPEGQQSVWSENRRWNHAGGSLHHVRAEFYEDAIRPRKNTGKTPEVSVGLPIAPAVVANALAETTLAGLSADLAAALLKRDAAGIIPCSDLPQTSNNIIQKGLAFVREWSGTVTAPGAMRASGFLPRRLQGHGGAAVVAARDAARTAGDPDVKAHRYATPHLVSRLATR